LRLIVDNAAPVDGLHFVVVFGCTGAFCVALFAQQAEQRPAQHQNTMTTQHTLDQSDLSSIIDAAKHASRSKAGEKRGSFPRFILRCDSESTNAGSISKLERHLSYIRHGATCWIWRNAGYGATISFDKPAHV
jgi:hypothetical protein